MAIAFTFNSVTIPGVNSWGGRTNHSIDALQKIGRDGTSSQVGSLGGLPITISGTIARSSEDLMRSAWATLLKALYDDDGAGIKAMLTVFDDREIECQLADKSVRFGKDKANLHACDYTLAFWADDPYWIDTAGPYLSEDTTMSTGDTLAVLAARIGDARCWPTITVTAGAGQITSDIVLVNSTTGGTWTFGANVAAGKALAIDMENHTVTNDGANAIDDVTHASSDWWHLRGRVENVIGLFFGGGAADVQLLISNERLYLNI